MKDSEVRFLEKNNLKEKMNMEGKLTAYVKLITLKKKYFYYKQKKEI